MKTVLFLIPSLGGGGAERVLVNLVNNMDRTKYRVTVQTLFDIGVNRQYLKEHIEYIPGMKKQFPGNVRIFKLLSPAFLYNLIVKKRYDIVVSYLEGPTARIVAGCSFDSKLVSWIHVEQKTIETAVYSYKNTEEYTRCANRFDCTVCVAQTVKDDYLSTVMLERPCVVLYNTNEDQEILDKASEPVEPLSKGNVISIASVGRLRYEKGYDRLVKIHRKLLDDGLKHEIFILGEGSEKEKIEDEIKRLNVQETFHLMGFHVNPYKYLLQADLFVCSSRKEGFSTAVTEALILSLPVVSTNCSGAKELLGDDDEYGIVVENSEEGIYRGLKKMLSTPRLIEFYREKAKARGEAFSKEKTVKAVEDMFDSLFCEERI